MNKKALKDMDDLLTDVLNSPVFGKKKDSVFSKPPTDTNSKKSYKSPSAYLDFKDNDKISDISDADENDIQNILKSTSQLDDQLFNTSRKSSMTSAMPNLSSNTKLPLHKKTSSFNEEDDPLDGIEQYMTIKNELPKKVNDNKSNARLSLFDDLDANDTLNDEAKINNNNKPSGLDNFSASFQSQDDQIFGGYKPSSTSASNRTKRNVKFSDEMFSIDEPPIRPKTSSTIQQHINDNNMKIDLSKSLPISDKPKFNFDWLKDDNTIDKKSQNNDWLEIKDAKLSVNSSFTSQNSDTKTTRGNEVVTSNQSQKEVNILNIDSMHKQSALSQNKSKAAHYQESISDFASETSGSKLNEKVSKNDDLFEAIFAKPPPAPQSQLAPTTTLTNALPLISTTSNSNDISLKIRILESENQELRQYLNKLKQDYEQEKHSLIETYENRLSYIKDNHKKHLTSERELLNEHIELIEKEKQNLMQLHRKKYDEIQMDCSVDIERLKETHKKSIELLKQEHNDAIRRIKEFKENEIEAAFAASSHTRTIETVLNSIHENTKNIDEISHKVKINHMMNLNEKEIELRTKEEQLKLQEERLQKQLRDYEVESKRLHETIDRLENHLAEQMKLVAEERWKSKQQEKKTEALQEALMNEQKIAMERVSRERADLDRTKDEILIEQKRLMQQVYEEKRKIAEEKAQLNAQSQTYKDKLHRDSLQNINTEANLNATTKYIQEEQARIKALDEQLKKERLNIDERKRDVNEREGKLEQISLTIKQKYIEAETMLKNAKLEQEKNTKYYKDAESLKNTHDSRLAQIQQSLAILNEKESRLNQEKIETLKERQSLELFKDSLQCSKCKSSIKEFFSTINTPNTNILMTTSNVFNKITPQMSTNLSRTLPAQTQNNSINDAKHLRQLKIQALKDKQYLNQERIFIDTLKTSLNRSFSLNQLNKLIA